MLKWIYFSLFALLFSVQLFAESFTQSLTFSLTNDDGSFITGSRQVIVQFRNAITDEVLWNSDGTRDETPSGYFTIFVARSTFSLILGDTSIEGMTSLDKEVFSGVSNVKIRVWVNTGMAFYQLSPDRYFSPTINAISIDYLEGIKRNGIVEQTEISDNVMSPGMIPRLDKDGIMPLMNAELLQSLNGNEITHGIVADKMLSNVILRNYGIQNISGSLNVSADVIGKTFLVSENHVVEGDSTIKKSQTLKNEVVVDGDSKVSGRFHVNNDISVNESSSVSGQVRIEQDHFLDGDLSVSDEMIFNGNIILKSSTLIEGSSTIDGDITVLGNSMVEGDSIVKGRSNSKVNNMIDGDLLVTGKIFVQGDRGLNYIEIGKTTAASARVTEFISLGDIIGSSTLFTPKGDFINSDVSGNTLSGNLTIYGNSHISGNLETNEGSIWKGAITIGMNASDKYLIAANSLFLSNVDLKNNEITNVNFVNGKINDVDIGQNVPKSGSFTNLKGEDLVISSSVSVPTASLEAQDIAGTAVTLAGSETLSNKTLTSPKVNGGIINMGTLNDVSIGQSTPYVATFTEKSVIGNTTLGDSTEDFLTINAQTKFSGPVEMPDVKMDLAKVSGGNINGTNIGMSVSAAGNFTNLEALNFKTGNLMMTGTTTLADNSIQSNEIEDGTIVTIDLADGSVTTGKILDGTIANVDLSDSSVNSAKVENNSLTSDDLGTGSVNSDEITDGTIVAIDLAVGSVTSEKVLDGTIGTEDLADSIVSSAKIIDGTIGTEDLADSIVSSAKIIDGTVSLSDIEDSAIDSSKVKNDSLTANDIAENAIGSSELADSSVDSAAIIDGTVTGTDILDGTITGSDISNGSVGSIDVENNSLTDSDLAENSVGASELSDSSVDTNALVDGAVTNVKISGVIDVSKISAGSETYIMKTVNDKSAWSSPPRTIPNLSDGKFFIGDARGVSSEQNISGDISISKSGVIDIASGVISSNKIIDKSLTNDDLAGGIELSKFIAGPRDHFLTSNGTSNQWATVSPHVSNSTVSSEKIVDNTIVTADLADNSVTSDKIKNGTVSNLDLAGEISATKITGTAATLDGEEELKNKTFSSPTITGEIALSVTDPSTESNIASKKYVDDALSTSSSADSIDSDMTTELSRGKAVMSNGLGGIMWGYTTGSGATPNRGFGAMNLPTTLGPSGAIGFYSKQFAIVKIHTGNFFGELYINTTSMEYIWVTSIHNSGSYEVNTRTGNLPDGGLFTYLPYYDASVRLGFSYTPSPNANIKFYCDKSNTRMTYRWY